MATKTESNVRTKVTKVGGIEDVTIGLGGVAWNEYAATDVARATTFLCGLFGWTERVKEFGFEGAYHTLSLGGEDVAGVVSTEDLEGPRVGGWFPVIRVADVDASVARGCELGASVLAAPSGIAGLSRHAMLAGPSHARFSLLCSLDGRAVRGPGCVGWNEIRATNPVATAMFMWQTFGWQAESARTEGDELLTVFTHQGVRVASMRKIGDGETSRCLPCIQVGDVGATVRRARDLGGALVEERRGDPFLGTVARIIDPLGCDFLVYATT